MDAIQILQDFGMYGLNKKVFWNARRINDISEELGMKKTILLGSASPGNGMLDFLFEKNDIVKYRYGQNWDV